MIKGEVVYLYAFDVANEIATAKISAVLGIKPVRFEIQVDRAFPRDVPLYRPLSVDLPPLAGQFQGQAVKVQVHIFDVGVVSISMRTAFVREHLAELLPFHTPRLDSGQSLDEIGRALCNEIFQGLKDCLVRPSTPTEPEAYTVFCLTDLGCARDANQWLGDNRRPLAGLLNETDPARLSDDQVNESLRLLRSYESTDLAVIDWDAALVVDLTGYVDDVLYILEMANLQLEEFRTMDQILDRYLNRAYEDLEKRGFSLWGRDAAVLRTLRWFRVDLTKLADEVTHNIKFLGDWYLARVYFAAKERFYLDQWRSSLEQRLAQLDRLYSVAHAELYERRMLWLEIVIVVFFAIDLLAIFLKK